jgi:hypothetical protein
LEAVGKAGVLTASALFTCGLLVAQTPAPVLGDAPVPAVKAAPKGEAPAPMPAPVSGVQAISVSTNSTTKSEEAKNGLESFEAICARMSEAKKGISELEEGISSQTKRISEILGNYNKAERNLTGFNGLGRVEQLELKAELYAGERIARKRITEECAVLDAMVSKWNELKAKYREDRKLYLLRKQINDMKAGSDSKGSSSAGPQAQGGQGSGMADIEYYQVKKTADLRTISSYPDVYGSPEFWDYIYKANKDKVSDPDKPVPAGTVLIIPQDVKKLPDFSGL